MSPALHQPGLSFTLQFKKNFKLVRLLNTGVLAEITNFEPLIRRRRRRRPEAVVEEVMVPGVRGWVSRRHLRSWSHFNLGQKRRRETKRKRMPPSPDP